MSDTPTPRTDNLKAKAVPAKRFSPEMLVVGLGYVMESVPQIERELADARECAEILHHQLQIVGEMYAGGKVPPLPELPWSQPDLSREALIAAVKGGTP
jgi:hypothetical protein